MQECYQFSMKYLPLIPPIELSEKTKDLLAKLQYHYIVDRIDKIEKERQDSFVGEP